LCHRIRHMNGVHSQNEILKNLTWELEVQNLEINKKFSASCQRFKHIWGGNLSEVYLFSQEDEIGVPKGKTRCICLPFWVGQLAFCPQSLRSVNVTFM
jgi:hypothetical protein